MPIVNNLVLCFLVLLCIGLLNSMLYAKHYCIRNAATGLNNGKNWVDAYNDLPNSLSRGDTFFIAGGTYKPHIFNDPLNGSQYIYLMKASKEQHGTDSGWNDSYATMPAIFTDTAGPIFKFRKGYYYLDGITGSGKKGYGIRIFNPKNDVGHIGGGTISVVSGDTVSNLHFRHLDIEGAGWGGKIKPATTRLLYFAGYVSNCNIQYCFLHEAGQQLINLANPGSNFVFEHSYFYNFGSGDENYHSSGIQVYGKNDTVNFIFRYNIMENMIQVGSTTYMQLGYWDGTPSAGYYIYGNVFLSSSPLEGPSRVIGNTSDDVTTNVHIYHNTFIKLRGYASRILFNNPNNSIYVKNNLWVNCERKPTFQNCIESNNSLNVLDTTIFTDFSSNDFSLKMPLPGAVPLDSIYSIDPNGIVRGKKDRVWDIGAFEFVDIPAPKTLDSIAVQKQ